MFRVVGGLGVVRCTAVGCGAVCRVSSCCAVLRCAVVCGGPSSLPFRRGMGSALVRRACSVVWDADRGDVAGWWPAGAVRCGVARWACIAGVQVGLWARGSGGCPRGCPPWGPVPWFCVLWGSCPSAFLPSPVLAAAAVSPSSSGAYAVACVVAVAVAGVVAWRLGYGVRLRGVFVAPPCGCSPFSLCGCTLLPLSGVLWPVGATRCGLCGARCVLRQRVMPGVRLWGSCGVNWGRGGAGLSVVACPSCMCALVPVVAPSPPVPQPVAFPFPGLLVVSCPRVALPWCPVPVGACLLPWASPPPRAAGLPFALSLPGVVVEGEGVWRRRGTRPRQPRRGKARRQRDRTPRGHKTKAQAPREGNPADTHLTHGPRDPPGPPQCRPNEPHHTEPRPPATSQPHHLGQRPTPQSRPV